NVKGAVYYECDGHTTPTEFMKKMLDYLKGSGVTIKANEEVVDLATMNGRITKITTNKGDYFPEEVIMAAGSWSNELSKKMNIKLPLQAGKGYSINVPRPTGITIPAILLEAKVAVTPMMDYTRFAGTMEFSGINDLIRKQRVEAIANAATEFDPDIKRNGEGKADAKGGWRPVSPDALPYSGKHSCLGNLTIATGHARMGWSLGPVTGKLVSEIIS